MVAFDTLKLSQELESAGFSREQAAGTAVALANAVDDTVATKADLQATETAIRADLREMDARISGELRLNRWMMAVIITATVIPFIRDFL